MNTTHQTLVNQIIEETQALPENLVREVLDFIGSLRAKYDQNNRADCQAALLATFGSWQDSREPQEIIQDIYANRTISERESGL